MKARVFTNGLVRVDYKDKRPREAIGVLGGRVLLVSDFGSVMESFPAGINPEVVDLGGRTVLPGFIDSHLHLLSLGFSLKSVSLNEVKSVESLKQAVRARAEALPPGKWIVGRGWDQELFKEKRYPTRKDLDEAAAGYPVFLRRVCGHLAVASSKALEIAGITRDTPDPSGGKIDRDTYGDPTGILRESAMSLVADAIPEPTQEEIKDALVVAARHALSRGITSVHTNDGGQPFQEMKSIYRSLRDAGAPLRIYWDMPWDYLNALASEVERTGDGDDFFRIGAVKIFADGSLGGRTAALEAPYLDDPGNTGMLVLSEEELERRVFLAHALGMQVAVHAIGDRAVRVSLSAVEKAVSKVHRHDHRHRLVHVQILSPGLITDMKRAGIVADVQPKFLSTDMRFALDRVGAERMRTSYAFRSLASAGVPLAGGSDSPVEPLDPLYGIYCAVTRKDMQGEPVGGYFPNERISVSEAIKLFTHGAAYAAFEEGRKGSLEPGKLADFVVLSHDPFAVAPEEIKDISVDMTVVEGAVAYENPDAN